MSIHKRSGRRGDTYEVRVRGIDGKERSRTFKTRKEAERYERDQMTAKDRGTWIDPRGGKVTLTEWAAEWQRTIVHLRTSSRRIYADNLRLHILPTLGAQPLARITPSAVRTWLADLTVKESRRGRPLSAASVHQAFRTLNTVLTAAVDNELIGRNPMAGVRPPRVPTELMRFLTAEEVFMLADEFDERYRALPLLAAFGGLRTGELAGLRWNRVNLLRRRVEVIEQYDAATGSFVAPKSKASVRTVALPRLVGDALAAHATIGFTEQVQGDGLVFTAPGGGVLDIDNFRARVWRPAVLRAGLDPLRIHDLRHTCASLAIAAGADVKLLQNMLGHASAAMTLDRYGHLMPGQAEAVAERLDALLDGRSARTA